MATTAMATKDVDSSGLGQQIPGWIAKYYREHRNKTPEQLFERLNQILAMDAEILCEWATIVRILDENGISIEGLAFAKDRKMLAMLRNIADGRLHPQAASRFLTKPMLLEHVAQLPLVEQEQIAKEDAIEIPVIRDGQTTWRLKPWNELDAADQAVVFGRDGRRSRQEMVGVVERRLQRAAPVPAGPVIVDMKRRELRITQPTRISASDLLHYYERLTGGK